MMMGYFVAINGVLMSTGCVVVVSGVLMFLLVFKHMLMMFLSFEYAMLGTLLMMTMVMYNCVSEFYSLFIMLVFVVCKRVLGLSLVVLLSLVWGNDFLSSLNLLAW